MKILLDASVYAPLVILAGSRLLRIADRLAILDLTVYEVCNAFWKEARKLHRISTDDAIVACKAAYKASKRITVIGLDDSIVEVAMRIAAEQNITFYDASYIAASIKLGLHLASEDKDILKAGPRYGLTPLRLQDVTLLLERS
ncbi:hypothetical protein Pyrfu_0565 [Pyrolobus fumarii 1A]|uniref:PIN domain-containing protein n=1 Tax=Pyrolobus fumarii (strain DSM 11204 / 1A) TaxID=694429 RepID=G0EGY5_PYRF1|nr:type II toxin-antitoxin system VapC family toxin [Pyrolobus fumarii]AEM38435.1 hypothetical protein Pyrfu_0565 [Pyrolobus fumarii 1A]